MIKKSGVVGGVGGDEDGRERGSGREEKKRKGKN